MYFDQLEVGQYFMVENESEIWRKIVPMTVSTIHYNSVCTSGSVSPFYVMGDNMPVRVVEFWQVKNRFSLMGL